jgi:hypothetical protein
MTEVIFMLRSEVGGSTMDLVDELLASGDDETKAMNIMNSLALDISGSDMDFVDELLTLQGLINKA